MDDGTLRIDDTLAIPLGELRYRAVRSSGPGGQHVNTSATKVELSWDVEHSPALSDDQCALLQVRLANRIDQRGVLRLVEGRRRSQLQNREVVTNRLAALVAKALEVAKKRVRTKPPRGAKEDRLREKRHRAETRKRRGPVGPDE
jgi:ribosome-associated protein